MPEQPQHLVRCIRQIGPRPEDRLHPRRAQHGIVLRRDDPARDDLDVGAAHVFQRVDQLGDQRLVPRREGRGADHVDRLGHRQLGCLARGLEQRPGDNLEPQVAERAAHQIRPPVMPILPHLRDQHARAAPEPLRHRLGARNRLPPPRVVALAVNPADRRRRSRIAPEHPLKRIGNLAERAARPRCLDAQRQQILSPPSARLQRIQRRPRARLVPRRAHRLQPRDLPATHLGIVDLENIEMRLLGQPIFVDPDDHRLAHIDLRRARRRGFLDPHLGQPLGDRTGHPAMRLDLVDQRLRLLLQLAGQRFNIV